MDEASKHLILIENPRDPPTVKRKLLEEVCGTLEIPDVRILYQVAAPRSLTDAQFASLILAGVDKAHLETIDLVGHGQPGQLFMGLSAYQSLSAEERKRSPVKARDLTLDADVSKRDDLNWLRLLVEQVRAESPDVIVRLLGCQVGAPPPPSDPIESINHCDGAVLLHFLASYLGVPVEAPLHTLTLGDYSNGYFALEKTDPPRGMRRCTVNAATHAVDFAPATLTAPPSPPVEAQLFDDGTFSNLDPTTDSESPLSPTSPNTRTFLRHGLTPTSVYFIVARWLHGLSVFFAGRREAHPMTAHPRPAPPRLPSRATKPASVAVSSGQVPHRGGLHSRTGAELPNVTSESAMATAKVRYPGSKEVTATAEQLACLEAFYSGERRTFRSPPLYATDVTLEFATRTLAIVGRCSHLVVHDLDADTWELRAPAERTTRPIIELLNEWGCRPAWLTERHDRQKERDETHARLVAAGLIPATAPSE